MEAKNIAQAVNSFGMNLYKSISDGKTHQNSFISPFSISVALAMTQLGAAGNTAKSMAEALQWTTEDGKAIHNEFKDYLTLLEKPVDQYLLTIANRIYVEKSYSVKSKFKNDTKSLYKAGSVLADFADGFEQERLNINQWVSEQTKDKIKDLIASGVLSNLTRMVLVNAIYFKGKWATKFDQRQTKQEPFKISPDQTKQVSMMHADKKFRHFIDEAELDCAVLELPYRGNELSMVVILPREDFGLQALELKLTPKMLNHIFQNLRSPEHKVEVTFPKFEVTSSFELKKPLSSLGMAEAFDQSIANFSNISDSDDLYVSEVVHKAFIKVDEEGTEAAAATAVVMMRCASMPMMKQKFIADHPFLFLIRDLHAGNSVLFMGRVADPSQ